MRTSLESIFGVLESKLDKAESISGETESISSFLESISIYLEKSQEEEETDGSERPAAHGLSSLPRQTVAIKGLNLEEELAWKVFSLAQIVFRLGKKVISSEREVFHFGKEVYPFNWE